MKKFAYLFTVGGRIHWSPEDEETIIVRATADDLPSVNGFINRSKPGEFIQLRDGEFIFDVSGRAGAHPLDRCENCGGDAGPVTTRKTVCAECASTL